MAVDPNAVVLYQYRLYCIQEATFVTTWATEPPTLCPNNHADRTIDPNNIVVIGRSGTNVVLASQNVLANFQHTCVPMNIPSMTPGGVYQQTFSWPMNIQIWKTEFYTTADHIGDYLTIYVAPNTTVGALTAGASVGATTINVSPTAVTNQLISNGIDLTITDGVNTNMCGRITGFSATTNTITFETPLVNSFSAGAFVQLSLKVINNVLLHRTNSVYRIGEKGLKGRLVPANTQLRADYTNMNGQAKSLSLVIEIYYQ